MDRVERTKELRDRYESALDDVERLRQDYHREVLKLHRSGMSLREIAEQLGISHQRVHQIVGGAEGKRPGRYRGAAVASVVALLVVGSFAAVSVTSGEGSHVASPDRTERRELPPTIESNLGEPVLIAGPGRGCLDVLNDHHLSAYTSYVLATAYARCDTSVAVGDPRTGEVLVLVVSPRPRAQKYVYGG